MNFFRPLVGPGNDVSLDMVIRHMDAVLTMGGEDILALGSDMDGCDDMFPKGYHGIESMPVLIEAMGKAGFGQPIIDKVIFGNAYSFIEQNL